MNTLMSTCNRLLLYMHVPLNTGVIIIAVHLYMYVPLNLGKMY